MHRKSFVRYGDPRGRKIPAKDYRAEVAQVKALFRAYPDHPGVKTATAWLDGLLIDAASGDRNIPGYRHFERLQRHGITGRDILIETSALWTYVQRNPVVVRSMDVVLTFALGICVAYLAKRDRIGTYRYPSGQVHKYSTPNRADREAIGLALRMRLAPLYLQIVAGVEQQEREKADAQASLSIPFTALKESSE